MHMCMRTTLDLDDVLMRAAKRRAAETGRTLTALVETALRELLHRETSAAECAFELDWTVVEGRVQAGVDVADRDALFRRMEEPG